MRTRIGALLCLLAACGGHAAPRPSASRRHLSPYGAGAPSDSAVQAVNVVGIVRGTDPALRDEAVLIDAHYADYHIPADEVARIDADHLAAMVQAAARAARLLADGVAPVWNPGGKP